MNASPCQGIPDTLHRNLGALTPDEQNRLLRARVAICGCGGLGGMVLENLVRIGIGQLVLFDPDRFEAGNLNRQLGATRHTLGRNKARVLAERAVALSSMVTVSARETDFRCDRTLSEVDLILDCLDNAAARKELAHFCAEHRLALIHGAVNRWYGQVAVQTGARPLVSGLYPESGDESSPSVLSVTVTAVAALQAAEAVKNLLGRPSRLENQWLSLDLTGPEFTWIPWPEKENA